MKKQLLFLVALLFGWGEAAVFLPVKATDPLVMLDEFVAVPTAGNEEWIELLNPSQTSSLDLTGWRLVVHQGPEGNYTYYYEQNLSGTVPRGGFLTFATDNDSRLPDDGACLVIFRDESNSVYAIKYGNGTCDAGAGEQDATGVAIGQGKSIYYNLDLSTWNSADSPTRGWCNPGSGECPTVATIVSQMGSEGVATNLADQTDFSRISNLYFLKSQNGQNIGKITFLAEMNFTDRDALTWMQSLDSKLDISQGVITLDADLIKNLTNTQASLTMYNITLANPKILVDGQDDTGSVVSGLSYDQTNHSLTFTAAHFTTFTAVENTSTSSSSTSPAGPPACGDWPPSSKPHLFQIDTTKNSATLYFTPVSDHLSYYYIAYGYQEGNWIFGDRFDSTQKLGVVSRTINSLAPNTTYYFMVRGGNGCTPGNWSNYLAAKTEGASVAKVENVRPKVTQPENEKMSPEQKPSVAPLPTSAPEPTKAIVTDTGSGEITPITSPTTATSSSFWQKLLEFFRNIFR